MHHPIVEERSAEAHLALRRLQPNRAMPKPLFPTRRMAEQRVVRPEHRRYPDGNCTRAARPRVLSVAHAHAWPYDVRVNGLSIDLKTDERNIFDPDSMSLRKAP